MATIISQRAASPANSLTPRLKSPPTETPVQTPTSSIRGSFDLPSASRSTQPTITLTAATAGSAVPGTPTSTSAPPARRVNRAALRDYYNLKTKPTQQSLNSGPGGGPGSGPGPGSLSRTASITSTTSNLSTSTTTTTTTTTQHANGGHPTPFLSPLPPTIDTPSFSPENYITTLLSSSSLPDILRIEATLVSEIRSLDGERKALVYDNYSKLIKAVGTIGEMQMGMNGDKDGRGDGGGLNRVGELAGRIEGVSRMGRGLAGLSGGGDSVGGEEEKDKERERQERKVRSEKRVLQRKGEVVKRVLAAPTVLRGLRESGRDEEAEREWTVIRGLLDAWEGVKGVKEVRGECEGIMMRSSSSSSSDDGKEGEGEGEGEVNDDDGGDLGGGPKMS